MKCLFLCILISLTSFAQTTSTTGGTMYSTENKVLKCNNLDKEAKYLEHKLISEKNGGLRNLQEENFEQFLTKLYSNIIINEVKKGFPNLAPKKECHCRDRKDNLKKLYQVYKKGITSCPHFKEREKQLKIIESILGNI